MQLVNLSHVQSPEQASSFLQTFQISSYEIILAYPKPNRVPVYFALSEKNVSFLIVDYGFDSSKSWSV